MKLPVLLGKINFPFLPGNEFLRNLIISDIDLLIWSIYLTWHKNISTNKKNKKSVKLPKTSAVCWNIAIYKIEIRK